MANCLILDDSEVIRLITRKILENLGHTSVETATVPEAVEACKTVRPDVIFLDWDLPSLAALDALKAFSEISQDPMPEIVLCAAENDASQFALARAAGARHHILKPYDLSTIRAVLEQVGVENNATADTSVAV